MRSWRRWLIGVGGALLAALAILAAVSWHFSDAVLVPDYDSPARKATVESASGGRIVLERNADTQRPGVYGLEWTGGHAAIGAILARDDDTVTRRLRDVYGYLVPGMAVGVEPNVWVGDPAQAFGYRSEDVAVRGELGPMPAWLVPGRGDTWAIVVHGINATPQTGLRIVPALHRRGLAAMLITYREDHGAPPSPDGFHHMGLTEWRDLEAAARYALAHGARRLVLAGYSMGGAIVTQFMQKSALATRVDALVLDAPALDWQRIIEFNAERMGYPGFAAWPVEWAVGLRIDADWASLDALRHTDDLQLPILLFHGEDDEVVPISLSDEFAAALPERVEYHRLPEAGHTESWNVDPKLYERRLEAFLGSVEPG